jgi:hypothetical protein
VLLGPAACCKIFALSYVPLIRPVKKSAEKLSLVCDLEFRGRFCLFRRRPVEVQRRVDGSGAEKCREDQQDILHFVD